MYTTIVVGTDGSATATKAVHRAASIASGLGAELHLVTAHKPSGAAAIAGAEAGFAGVHRADWDAELRTQLTGALQELINELAAGGVKTSGRVVDGHPVAALLEAAKALDAGLIVVGNKGMKGARRVLGSVPNDVAHKAECDVLIVNTTA
jgi:nucleotide-binding universal stress UspA family protein